jgi:hypothetical protein
LSVDAVQATVIEVVVAPVTRSPAGIVGGCVSALGGGGGLPFRMLTVMLAEALLPATSNAVALRTWLPFVYLVVSTTQA